MPLRPLESWEEVGRRIAGARGSAGYSQAQLAAEIGLERTAIAKLEAGSRALSSLELARLATALGRPIEWFVSDSPPSVVSRRAEYAEGFDLIGIPVDAFARDIELLFEVKTLQPLDQKPLRSPSSLDAAEDAARQVREQLGHPEGPLTDLGTAVGSFGLHVTSIEIPESSADGAYVALEGAGATVVNGHQPAGRRRFTLAHELGHHLMADEYSTDWAIGDSKDERERLINAFAVHLLMPRRSILRDWQELGAEQDPRRAAIQIGVQYRASWSAVCSQLANLELLDKRTVNDLRVRRPGKADLLELGLFIVEELAPPYVSPVFAQAVLRAYSTGRVGRDRTLELLRGTLSEEDLPAVDVLPEDALRGELP